MNGKIWMEDLENLIYADGVSWERFRQKVVLITGASGLIGSCLVRGLLYADHKLNLQMRVLALVRNRDKALEKFADLLKDSDALVIVQGDVNDDIGLSCKVDFIIHGASPTASRYFIDNPVETIRTSVDGTINMLELARKNIVEGFVYLSSMEVYGATQTEELLSEKDVGYMNPLLVRNSYPESKRLCEALCVAYSEEYAVPAMSIRLSQTFGPGVEMNDIRVFAEFARCAIDKKDIVLLTDGGSKRCYLYTMDAVSAILTILLKGKPGKAYNAGNPETYCSVREMAQMVAHELAGDRIIVKVSDDKESRKKFPPHHFYHLDMTEIFELGWQPVCGLREMYLRMIAYM